MRKVNTNQLESLAWSSPKGKFAGTGIQVSEALGRKRDSTDLLERHPFDVEILRVPPGKAPLSLAQRATGVLSRDFGARHDA
jgi:hypothetical protein